MCISHHPKSISFSFAHILDFKPVTHSHSQCLSLAACLLICPPKGNLNEVSQLFPMKVNCSRTATNERVNLCLMPEARAAGSGSTMGGDIKTRAEASSHPANRFTTEWADPDLERISLYTWKEKLDLIQRANPLSRF